MQTLLRTRVLRSFSSMENDPKLREDAPDLVGNADVGRTVKGVGDAVAQITEDPGYIEFSCSWQGIALQVRHNACWLGRCAGLRTHHIELRSADRVELPVTATGYRSHFLHGEDPFAEFDGDVLAYVHAWLDCEAERPDWKRHVEASRQLSLF